MKFRQVEIECFRAYHHKEDGLFNFSINDGQVANLVSIYAPNGFGKTSFYDAVEWCMTHRIKRLDDADSIHENIRAERARNKASDVEQYSQDIIRHKESQDNEKGFVRIWLEGVTNKIEKKIASRRGGATDYPRDSLIYPEFRQVILSQEGIDSFLRSETAYARYSRFIEYFDSQDLDRLFNNLLELIKENESELSEISTQLGRIQSELDRPVDRGIVQQVNRQVQQLSKGDVKIPFLPEKFGNREYLLFIEQLVNEKNKLMAGDFSGQQILSRRLQALEELKTTFPAYQTYKTSVSQSDRRIAELELKISALQKLERLKNDLQKNNAEEAHRRYLIGEANKALAMVPDFTRNREERTKLEDEHAQHMDYRRRVARLAALILQYKSDWEFKLRVLRERQDEFKERILKFTIQDEQNKIESRQLETIRTESKLLDESIAKLEAEDTNLLLRINEMNSILLLIKNKIFDFENVPEEAKSLLRHLKIVQHQISDTEDSIRANEATLKETRDYVLLTESLIEMGKRMLAQKPSSSCPLCSAEYLDTSLLLEQINSIDRSSSKESGVQQLILQKQERLQDLHLQKIEAERSLQEYFENILKNYSVMKSQALLRLTEERRRLKDMEVRATEIRIKSDLFHEEFKNASIIDFLQDANNSMAVLRNNSLVCEEVVRKYESYQLKVSMRETMTFAAIENLAADIRRTAQDKVILQWEALRETLELTIMNEQTIMRALLDNNKELEKLLTESSKYKVEIEKLMPSPHERNLAQLEKALLTEKQGRSELSDRVAAFDANLTSINISSETDNILSAIEIRLQSLLLDLQRIDDTLRSIANLEDFSIALSNLIKYQENLETRNSLQNKQSARLKIKEDLNLERNVLEGRIKNMIQAFFYEDQINFIFNKIDAHPESKQVRFDVSFESGKPALNIFVKRNETSPEEISPPLYFSSAQVNVLSLSIFLAKALHAKDGGGNPIHCLFIDDPIQSMDSINMLSVIDLLRNIIVELDKQIIISTHDENFHALLKKKIPSNVYKSKFLRLETFGKVIAD